MPVKENDYSAMRQGGKTMLNLDRFTKKEFGFGLIDHECQCLGCFMTRHMKKEREKDNGKT